MRGSGVRCSGEICFQVPTVHPPLAAALPRLRAEVRFVVSQPQTLFEICAHPLHQGIFPTGCWADGPALAARLRQPRRIAAVPPLNGSHQVYSASSLYFPAAMRERSAERSVTASSSLAPQLNTYSPDLRSNTTTE